MNILVITCCRNLCPNTSPDFFVVVQAEHPNYLTVHWFHSSPQRTQLVTFVNAVQQTTINQLFFPARVVIGFVNIKSWVFSTSLIPVSLSNQPLRQHRRTWFRPSYSGYNTSTSSCSNTKFPIPNIMHNPAAAASADLGYGVVCRQCLTLRRQVVYGTFVANAYSAGRAMVIRVFSGTEVA